MGWTVLCISDDSSALLLYRSMLEFAGSCVLAVPTVKEGLNLSKYRPVDCIVLDLRRYRTRLVRRIARQRPGIPLILVSGNGEMVLQLYTEVEMFIARDEAVEELPERVEEIMRRSGSKPSTEHRNTSASRGDYSHILHRVIDRWRAF
jgi:DNA-binding NtrC family response regulator